MGIIGLVLLLVGGVVGAGVLLTGRSPDDTEAVAGIHLAAGLLAGAAELQTLDEAVAHDLWQVGLAAADLAGSGADLGAVAAATAATATASSRSDPAAAAPSAAAASTVSTVPSCGCVTAFSASRAPRVSASASTVPAHAPSAAATASRTPYRR